MRKDLIRSAIAIVAVTAVFGFAYPAVMTGFALLAFHNKADGSLITENGRVVGSKLSAQAFTGQRYFHPRPSATDPPYDADGTTFSNLGPNSKQLESLVMQRVHAILKLEGPYNPGLTAARIPVDAVTASGSGIDPEISMAYAELQAPRVASLRGLPLATVQSLIGANTDGRSLDFLGEPGVNVLELNLALDQEH
ncbi:MAG TPA: potassium-transporting ATPase subunit KdpC [Gaiellales bacterium]|nr:potassium-transporting ATPase subunit KdpC [Gaiellales bacterium]